MTRRDNAQRIEPRVDIEYCFTDDEAPLVPPDAAAALPLADLALLPHTGDVIFITPRSPWTVAARTFQRMADGHLRIQLWLLHNPAALAFRRFLPLAAVPKAPPAAPEPE